MHDPDYTPGYIPDRWVIVKITNLVKNESHERVLAGWYGGYLGGDSWRMNSGIVGMRLLGDRVEFVGSTGSKYICYRNCYGMTGLMGDVLDGMIKQCDDKVKIELSEKFKP